MPSGVYQRKNIKSNLLCVCGKIMARASVCCRSCWKKNGGNKYWLGKKRPEMSAKVKGHVVTEETKQKIREKRKLQVITEEHKQKLREHFKGRKPWNAGKKNPKVSGANSNFWKGGLTKKNKAIRMSMEYRLWRTAVFERDKYSCVLCGYNKGGILEADHMTPFALLLVKHKIETLEQSRRCKELWDVSNGRTLCHPCHKKTPTYGVGWFSKKRGM